MVTVYIKKQQFFKNVDEFGNIFEIQYPTRDVVSQDEYSLGTFTETYDNYIENGFTKVELNEQYKDCNYFDFNEDLTFNVEKYNARKQRESNQRELAELQPELDKLTEDLIQAQAGAIIPDLEERKARFQVIHNRIREIKGKEPRKYFS